MRAVLRAATLRRWAWLAPAALVVSCSSSPGSPEAEPAAEPATLRISVVDAATGAPTPARLELVDERGVAHVPPAALRLPGECAGHAATPSGAPPSQAGAIDPLSGREQFYAARPIDASLPAGRYRVTARKGLEYGTASASVELAPGETRELELAVERWAHLARAGWFSADDHLHLRRTSPDGDRALLEMARAEDLNVANLLQMGAFDGVVAAPQRAFGDASVVQEGETILASGQENPRAWILGHAIVLGARAYLDVPERYLVYREVWEEARAQGALTGYAHFRAPGLLLDAPDGLIDFLEVLQFDALEPRAWYDVLNLGIRITPTAGTDFPCAPAGPPGAQRFYARVDGPLRYDAWLDAVRRGRTFVTNGPLLELEVDGVGIGGELRLAAPGAVRVTGSVRFDPARDDVARLELVEAGEVVRAESEPAAPGLLRLEVEHRVEASTWLALRAIGTKPGGRPTLRGEPPASAAHSAPIYVAVEGSPPLAAQPRAAATARRMLEQLDRLAGRFTPRALKALRGPARVAVSGIDAATGQRDRDAVLAEIERARSSYEALAAHAPAPAPADPTPTDAGR